MIFSRKGAETRRREDGALAAQPLSIGKVPAVATPPTGKRLRRRRNLFAPSRLRVFA